MKRDGIAGGQGATPFDAPTTPADPSKLTVHLSGAMMTLFPEGRSLVEYKFAAGDKVALMSTSSNVNVRPGIYTIVRSFFGSIGLP